MLAELLRDAEASLAAGRLDDAQERLDIVVGAGPSAPLEAEARRLLVRLGERRAELGGRPPDYDPCRFGYVLEVERRGTDTMVERCVLK